MLGVWKKDRIILIKSFIKMLSFIENFWSKFWNLPIFRYNFSINEQKLTSFIYCRKVLKKIKLKYEQFTLYICKN
ncbi:hypothetical protein ACM40_04230 [Chryseobacterium sp. BLS98]|nr:hypothetical protein ACM40_04230 [Chryseobacterium sp. BLS98]